MQSIFLLSQRNALLIAGILCILPRISVAQELQRLTIQQAYELSRQNYPALKRKGLISKTESLSVQNLNTAFYPQLSVNGSATYQSDVTMIDIKMPGINIPVPDKNQYRLTAELSQQLYDGGLTRAQRSVKKSDAGVEESKVDVELYHLKDRINQLFFAILYNGEMLRQSELLSKNVQAGIDKVKPQVENGLLLRSSLQVLQAQLLQTRQHSIEIRNARAGLINALSTLTGQPLSSSTEFVVPEIDVDADTAVSRPELNLYQRQSELLQAQESLINARNRPRASLFIQGGYGRPGLNILSDSFDPFYIAGLRINWTLGGLYTSKREKQLADISKSSVDLQKETFLLNTRSLLQQQAAEIKKIEELISSDAEIIGLRASITESARAQLENAVITSGDYLREVNAEDQARQAQSAHRLQLLQAKTNYLITAGKL